MNLCAVLFPTLAVLSVTSAFEWTSTSNLPSGGARSAGLGGSFALAWDYEVNRTEHVVDIEWHFEGHNGDILIAGVTRNDFYVIPGIVQNVTRSATSAGIDLNGVNASYNGLYTVIVHDNFHGHVESHSQHIYVLVDTGERPENCQDVQAYDPTDGVHMLYINGLPVPAYCDQTTEDGGWTVIQRRQDGSVDFFRDWTSYEDGFGDLAGEYWLGLSTIHALTTSENYSVRVDLEDFEGNTASATYNHFSVGGPETNYTLHVTDFSNGTAGPAFTDKYYTTLDNQPFSTYDRDNDNLEDQNCAKQWHTGWWANGCFLCNLNGQYKTSGVCAVDGVTWFTWYQDIRSMKKAAMKVAPATLLD